MAYFNTCPYCGATLDPGERCDCKDDTGYTKRNSEPQAKEKTSSTANA